MQFIFKHLKTLLNKFYCDFGLYNTFQNTCKKLVKNLEKNFNSENFKTP